VDAAFICRGAGLELIETGTWCLPGVALAVALNIIYPPCARRAVSLLIRVSVWCAPRLLVSSVVVLLRLWQTPANANCGAVVCGEAPNFFRLSLNSISWEYPVVWEQLVAASCLDLLRVQLVW